MSLYVIIHTILFFLSIGCLFLEYRDYNRGLETEYEHTGWVIIGWVGVVLNGTFMFAGLFNL